VSQACWYAVHVRSNQEQTTAAFLAGRGVAHFLPTYRTRSRRKDRKLILTRPLFKGYLFVEIDIAGPQRIDVLKAPGTVRIVEFGGRPTPVPAETIHSIEILVGEGADEVRPHPLVREGQRVAVLDGPFAGARGKIVSTGGRKPKLVVEVEFLGRAVSVPIAAEQVEPVFD
jgi:transcription antitermination factor NusG